MLSLLWPSPVSGWEPRPCSKLLQAETTQDHIHRQGRVLLSPQGSWILSTPASRGCSSHMVSAPLVFCLGCWGKGQLDSEISELKQLMWIKSLPWVFCSRWKNYSLSYFLSQIPSSTAPNTAPKRFLSSGEAGLMKESVRTEPWHRASKVGERVGAVRGLLKGHWLLLERSCCLGFGGCELHARQKCGYAWKQSPSFSLSLLFPFPSFFSFPTPQPLSSLLFLN